MTQASDISPPLEGHAAEARVAVVRGGLRGACAGGESQKAGLQGGLTAHHCLLLLLLLLLFLGRARVLVAVRAGSNCLLAFFAMYGLD